MAALDEKSQLLSRHLFLLRRGMQKSQASCWSAMADITGQEMRALIALNMQGPLMMKGLADLLGLAANSVTSLVDKLETGGFARRRRRDDDRRVVEVVIADKGRAAVESVVDAELEFCRSMLERLSGDDQDRFLELTRKMVSGIEG